MTNESRERFLADRARALATVILTRRDDLILTAPNDRSGLDLHVHIDREDRTTRLTFGIVLRATSSPGSAEDANRILGPTLGQFEGMRKITYPVCVFFFAMREEQAYFCWLAEPTMTPDGPKLAWHDEADCVELTNEVVNQVVERVVAWYDAVEAVRLA